MSFDENTNSELQPEAQDQLLTENMETTSSPASSTSDTVQCTNITSFEEAMMSGEQNIDSGVLAQELDTISLAIQQAAVTPLPGGNVTLEAEDDDRRELAKEEETLETSDDEHYDDHSLPELEEDPVSCRSDNREENQGNAPNSGDESEDSALAYTHRKRKNPQACLDGLPDELLDGVLSHLLINPELGRSTSITRDNGYGSSASYDLHPYVLRTSKRIHERGVGVLYGLNKFYAACLPNGWPQAQSGSVISSPLTRFWSEDTPHPTPAEASGLQQVQAWLIVLHIANLDTAATPRYPVHSIRDLCRIICRSTQRAVDIAVVTKGVQRDIDDNDYDDIQAVLTPFKLLRGVEQFSLRDASPLEIPQVIEQDDDALFYESHLEDHPALQVEMMLTCTDPEPIEFAFDMYERLLKYAQAFESHEPFKLEMAMATGSRLDEDIELVERSERPPYASKIWFHQNNPLRNPYRDYDSQHPVEAGLQGAAVTAEYQDVDVFKLHRTAVLEYLEPQFKRMAECAATLVASIYKSQQWEEFFDPERMGRDARPESDEEGKELLELLKQFKDSFVRDSPEEIKSHISQRQAIFDSFYFPEIELKLQRMSMMLPIRNFAVFVELFCSSFDELYASYFSIREARKDLFGADTFGQPGFELDLELGPEVAFIDWTDIHRSYDDYRSDSDRRSYRSDDDDDDRRDHNNQDGDHNDSDHDDQASDEDANQSGDESGPVEEEGSFHGSEDDSAPDGHLPGNEDSSVSVEKATGTEDQAGVEIDIMTLLGDNGSHNADSDDGDIGRLSLVGTNGGADGEVGVAAAVGTAVTQDEEAGLEDFDNFDADHRVPGAW